MYGITYIQPNQLDTVWDSVKVHIENALKHCNELHLQDVKQSLESQKMGLVVITSEDKVVTSVVVEYVDYPQITALRVVALGGDKMEDWIPALDQFLTMWGQEMSADRIEIMGRRGWVKALAPHDYSEKYTFITKDIHHG